MIAYHYLLISSALDCASKAPSSSINMAQGRLSDAQTSAMAASELANGSIFEVARIKQVCGDIHLLRGALEDAEESYRSSLKSLGTSPEAEALSCRAAGLLALFQKRFETAASCFQKIVKASCGLPLRVEAHIFLAQIFFEAGLRTKAQELLTSALNETRLACHYGWQHFISLVLYDFDVRIVVQNQIELRDDIYWQSLGQGVPQRSAPSLDPIDGPYDASVARLIRQRADELGHMLSLARGYASDSMALQSSLGNTRLLSLQCHQTLVLELTQAALAGKLVHIAEILIVGAAPVALQRNLSSADGTDPQQRQLLHCYAKLRLLQGLTDEGLALYANYALLAMQAMRNVYPITQLFDDKPQSHYAVVKDDISARLPARYRRAYQYMLAHAHLPSLSINDVANVIGVSERALQLAFKEHIGLTPREVLRRFRMQKIREDLQEATGAGVMEVAMKHGIKNRTALTAGYRRYYNETPSKTTMS